MPDDEVLVEVQLADLRVVLAYAGSAIAHASDDPDRAAFRRVRKAMREADRRPAAVRGEEYHGSE